MSDNSKIEWTHRPGTVPVTWNPITGCTKISEGCKHCYAERMSKRLAGRFGYPEAPNQFDVTWHEDKLSAPLHWRKPRTVFVVSMGDLFHEDVNFSILQNIWNIMETAGKHTFLVLTKRPDRMLEFLTAADGRIAVRGYMRPLPNVWLGVTAENQKRADARIPLLLQCPAAVRFVSYEPALGEVNFHVPSVPDGSGPWRNALTVDDPYTKEHHLDWVIAGGESGPGARPAHPDWFRGVRDQCEAAGVPFFFKSWGAFKYAQYDPDWRVHRWASNARYVCSMVFEPDRGDQMIGNYRAYKVGKKAAGHLLDGKEHHEWPAVGGA